MILEKRQNGPKPKAYFDFDDAGESSGGCQLRLQWL